MTLTTEQLRARAKFWREKAVEAKWESVSIAQDMLQNADAFDELANNREAQPVALDVIARFKEWNTGFPVEKFKADYVIGWVLANYYTPPAPVNAAAWEMRYWSDGYNIWGDWERISEALYTRLSAEHATDNDYEFRVLYDAPPAPAVPEEMTGGIAMSKYKVKKSNYAQWVKGWNACRAAMLAQPVSSGCKLPDKVREALTLALQAMEFMGDTLNNIDAVCTEDVEYVTPAFNAVRELLAAAPDGGNGHDTRR
ncbi:TPA: hypothetical protein ACIJYK_003012 [Serratia marcescens]